MLLILAAIFAHGQTDTILLKNGKYLYGYVLSVNQNRQLIKFRVAGVTERIPIDSVANTSFDKILNRSKTTHEKTATERSRSSARIVSAVIILAFTVITALIVK